jgi:Cu(I)/Ag(I) efflux system membrane fusion protein
MSSSDPEKSPVEPAAETAHSGQPEANHLPHAIRGLRVMAVVRWVLLALVTALAAHTVWTYWRPQATSVQVARPNRYYCSMHPQIRSPDPGTCPICHMDLVPIPVERQTRTTEPTTPAASAASPSDVVAVSISAEKQHAIGISTTVVARDSLGDSLRVPGVISAPETGISQVRVRASGFVERVAVQETGVRVARGQTLAWIYSPDIYRAEEEFLAATRWSAGAPASGTVSPGSVELLSAARRGLELLGMSSADIDAIVRSGQPTRALPVRAPSSGYVTRFNAVLGFRADPEMVLYEIADLSRVWVIASVYERDLASVRVGMAAEFSATGSSAPPVTAHVDLIEPELNEATRSARVRLVLPNRDLALRPGQFGEVTFQLPAAEGLFVPHDAVIRTGEHDYVYVSTTEDRFEPRTVRTGAALGERVQVLEGVVAGDRVVTRGSFMLDSESRLEASLAAVPASASTP